MNTPIGLLGLSSLAREVWMRCAIISSAWRWPMTRSLERVGELEHRLDLVLHHPADRNAGPVRDDRRRPPARRRVGRMSGRLALQLGELRPAARAESASSFCVRSGVARASTARLRAGAVGSRARGGGCACRAPSTGFPPARSFSRSSRMPSTSAFSSRQRSSSPPSRSRSAASFASASARRDLGVDADRLLAPDDLELGLQRLDAAPAVLDLRRRRVLADRHARAGGVEQAHGLVRQLARRECSGARAAPRPRAPRRGAARGGASRASRPRRAS